jgi:hypothetical protein
MTRFTRSLTVAGGLLAACAIIGVGAGAVGAKSKGRADSGTAYVANTPKPGGLIFAAGFDQDKILGSTAILYQIKAEPNTPGTVKVVAKHVTLYTGKGSLTGTASATLTTPKTGPSIVSGGKLNLTKGFGDQKGHSLNATFTGSGSLTGVTFTFKYKGTYK